MFTYGADPEIFLKKKGKAVSAFGLIPGTKSLPFPTEHGAYQVDGTAVEFNINPTPMYDFEKFNFHITTTMKTLKAALPGFNFNISPVQEYTQEYLDSLPDAAKELGCDPDFSAYTLLPNPAPDYTRLFRTGAGHVHVGWGSDIPTDNEDHIEICANFVKALDATVGMFMTVIDTDPRRRELYGKAGAFRPKPYGVEYRTPSNLWLTTKNRRWMMWTLLGEGIRIMKSEKPIETFINCTQESVQSIINDGDVSAALAALRYLGRTINWNNSPKFQGFLKSLV